MMKVSKSIILLAAIAHISPQVFAADNSIRRVENIFDDGAVELEVVGETTDLFTDKSFEFEADGLFSMSMSMNYVEYEAISTEEPIESSINTVATEDTGVGVAAVNMLNNQILCGYQGWYSFPGDEAPINRWRHWFKGSAATVSAPLASDLSVDMYPTMDEYNPEDLKESGIKMKDGSNAKFFSSSRPNVVLKHFQWMKTYGISGVFQVRFMESLQIDANRETKTMVLRNSKAAAEATGRIFALSYDLSGASITDAVLDDLKADWIRLVDKENITQSTQYIRQNDLPVLNIFGIGFATVNVSDTTKMAALIKWLQNDAPAAYRVFLVGGVPSRWRTLDGDSRTDPAWKGIYDSLDAIHPWHVGRWKSISAFDTYYTNTISADATYCASKGILYLPTMWPGFSWHNLKSGTVPVNSIPRLGGTFMWRQAYKYAAASNINTVWLAMFDEVDEGTAIFKVTAKSSDLPVEGTWLALDADAGYSVPSDHYLRLAGEAQKMLDGRIPVSGTFPTPSPTRAPTQKPTTKAPVTKAPTLKPTTKAPTKRPVKPTKQKRRRVDI